MSMDSFPKPKSQQETQELKVEKLETGKKVFDFLEKTRFLETRKSDEQFDQWIQKLSYEDFSNYLTRLNGILREVPIKQRSVDGKGVEVSFGTVGDEISYLPPAAEEKENLMRETFEAVKSIPDNEDRGLLIYYALQAIHPYSDGNGRTGRLLHELISAEGKELSEEKLSGLLDHDKAGHAGTGEGRDTFAEKVLEANMAYYYINREVAKEVLGDDFVKEYGRINPDSPVGIGRVSEGVNVTPEERQLAEKVLGEGDVPNFQFRGIVMAKFLQEKGRLQDFQYTITRSLPEGAVVPEDVGKKMFGLEQEKLEPELTAEDVRRLIEINKDVKARFVRDMIDIFANPDKHQLKTKDGRGVAVKSAFRK